MVKTKRVTFTRCHRLTSKRDGIDYKFEYSIVESQLVGTPEEVSSTKNHTIVVGISGTLAAMWRFDEPSLTKVLFEYGTRHIKDKVFDRTLRDNEELQLATNNAPKKCLFDPDRIDMNFPKAYEFPAAEENPVEKADPLGLASQVIDLRDNINVLYGERFGGRLLSLPQERGLLELFRTCNTQEDFGYRVPSLCSLATSFDEKSIDGIGAFLRTKFTDERVNPIIDELQKFNQLRRMYPVHTDRAKGVMAAHKHFGLEYPVKDYQEAWTKLISAYLGVLKSILWLIQFSERT